MYFLNLLFRFFQHVHDQFIQELHDHVLDEWGIEIQNIRIESLKISDRQLQKSISNQAIDVSKQHNKYIMLQKKQEIIIVEANAGAEKNRIDTEAEATRIRAAAQVKWLLRDNAMKKGCGVLLFVINRLMLMQLWSQVLISMLVDDGMDSLSWLLLNKWWWI